VRQHRSVERHRHEPRRAVRQCPHVAERRRVELRARTRQRDRHSQCFRLGRRRTRLAPGGGGCGRARGALAGRLEVVARRVESRLPPARDERAARLALQVEEGQLGQLRLDREQVERRIVAVVDLELELRGGRSLDRHAELVGGEHVANRALQPGLAQADGSGLRAGEARLAHARKPREVAAADRQPQRHDRQRRTRQAHAKAARAGLARAAVEGERR
jgi:hypothetical protein